MQERALFLSAAAAINAAARIAERRHKLGRQQAALAARARRIIKAGETKGYIAWYCISNEVDTYITEKDMICFRD